MNNLIKQKKQQDFEDYTSEIVNNIKHLSFKPDIYQVFFYPSKEKDYGLTPQS